MFSCLPHVLGLHSSWSFMRWKKFFIVSALHWLINLGCGSLSLCNLYALLFCSVSFSQFGLSAWVFRLESGCLTGKCCSSVPVVVTFQGFSCCVVCTVYSHCACVWLSLRTGADLGPSELLFVLQTNDENPRFSVRFCRCFDIIIDMKW